MSVYKTNLFHVLITVIITFTMLNLEQNQYNNNEKQ